MSEKTDLNMLQMRNWSWTSWIRNTWNKTWTKSVEFILVDNNMIDGILSVSIVVVVVVVARVKDWIWCWQQHMLVVLLWLLLLLKKLNLIKINFGLKYYFNISLTNLRMKADWDCNVIRFCVQALIHESLKSKNIIISNFYGSTSPSLWNS